MSDRLLPDWPAPRGVVVVGTTRRLPGCSLAPFDRCNLGARTADDFESVINNRAGLVRALNLPSAPVWLKQVHGIDVHRVEQMPPSIDAVADEPQADAAVTTCSGVVLAVLTADCLPVVFAAEDGAVVAVAHAGWRGLAAGVLERTLASMAVDPARIQAWLGAAIGADDYEVGVEVRRAFIDWNPAAASCFLATRPDHWLCDLYALARLRLQAAGVSRIHGGGENTYADGRRFYSYRREGANSGRQATLVWRT